MKKLWILSMAVFGFIVGQPQAAVLFPSIMAPLRSAIVDEIEILTNSPALTTEEARQLRLLNQARRNIDRAGRISLFGDVQILASVSTGVTHAFPEGEFDPLLQAAIADYAALLGQFALDLTDTISQLPPSSATTLASNTVASVITLIEQLDPAASVTTGIRTITRAATRLRSAEGFISRARSSASRINRLTAIVDGRRFAASPSAISASYSSGSQSLTIVGRDLGTAFTGSRSIQLVLSGVVPGTTTHSLRGAGSGSYATYSANSPTNSMALNSIAGSVLVTLNVANGSASGRFSFDAGDPFSGQNAVRVTGGEFSVRLLTP